MPRRPARQGIEGQERPAAPVGDSLLASQLGSSPPPGRWQAIITHPWASGSRFPVCAFGSSTLQFIPSATLFINDITFSISLTAQCPFLSPASQPISISLTGCGFHGSQDHTICGSPETNSAQSPGTTCLPMVTQHRGQPWSMCLDGDLPFRSLGA